MLHLTFVADTVHDELESYSGIVLLTVVAGAMKMLSGHIYSDDHLQVAMQGFLYSSASFLPITFSVVKNKHDTESLFA